MELTFKWQSEKNKQKYSNHIMPGVGKCQGENVAANKNKERVVKAHSFKGRLTEKQGNSVHFTL